MESLGIAEIINEQSRNSNKGMSVNQTTKNGCFFLFSVFDVLGVLLWNSYHSAIDAIVVKASYYYPDLENENKFETIEN